MQILDVFNCGSDTFRLRFLNQLFFLNKGWQFNLRRTKLILNILKGFDDDSFIAVTFIIFFLTLLSDCLILDVFLFFFLARLLILLIIFVLFILLRIDYLFLQFLIFRFFLISILRIVPSFTITWLALYSLIRDIRF